MKRICLLIASLILTVTFPNPIQAQSGITILDSSVEVQFPEAITFSLEAQSTADINDIALQYKVERTSYAPLISERYPEFTPSSQVETSWTWDLIKAWGLPPGAEVSYRWLVEDEAGQEIETEWQAFEFDDHRYQWQSLSSDSVTLFWYEEDQWFAKQLMDAAEEALDRLYQDTGASLEGEVELYIYASYEDLLGALIYAQEWTGGLAFPEYGIIVIGIPIELLDWGERAVAHELAHLVIHQMTSNPYGDLPSWLDEGLATYNEGDLDPYFQSLLDEAISEDDLFSVRSLGSSFPTSGEEAGLCYAESYSLVEFLITEYGSEEILNLLSEFEKGSTYDDALQQVYDFDIDGLDSLWRASLGLEPQPTPAPPEPSLLPLLGVLVVLVLLPGVVLIIRYRARRGKQSPS